jgi:hypothetical protein
MNPFKLLNSIFRSFTIALVAALMVESAWGQALAPSAQQPSQAETNRSVPPELADQRAITEATIGTFVSKIDAAVMKGDVDSYANMLADDFTVTITSDIDSSQLPQHQSKAVYVRGMREGIKGCRVLEAKTTIDNTIITDLHARAVVYCTLTERNLVSGGKRTCDVTVRQKFELELRKEGLKITKLEFQVAGVKLE